MLDVEFAENILDEFHAEKMNCELLDKENKQLRAELDEARKDMRSILNLARGDDEISAAHTITTIAVTANDFLEAHPEETK